MIPDAVHVQNLRALLAPIADLLESDELSEIMINGCGRIYVERRGRLLLTDRRFAGDAALQGAVRGIAQWIGRSADADDPILEGRLPDGSRVEIVLPPAAPDGPVLCIRRFTAGALTLERMLAAGAIDEKGAALLQHMVEARRNLLISGGTGSGKTSLLNALARFIPQDQRLIVIEDARELQLPHPHVVHLAARAPDARGRHAVTMRALFRASLRLRPDRIVVGEVRGAEAIELIQAMTSGHAGCLSTIHGNDPRGALARLETLALMSELELPLWALRAQIAGALDAVVQTARTASGARAVVQIAEVAADDDGYALHTVYLAPGMPVAGEGSHA